MPLDLRTANALWLQFYAALPLSTEVAAALEAALGKPLEADHAVRLVQHQGPEDQRQVATLDLYRTEDRLLLIGRVGLGEEVPPSGSTVRTEEFLRVFGEAVKQRPIVEMNCLFRYSPDRYTLLFPLPIPLQPISPGVEFDEIRGVRLAKKVGVEAAYQVIVDRPENAEFSANVIAEVQELLDQGLPERLLAIAASVASKVTQPVSSAPGEGGRP